MKLNIKTIIKSLCLCSTLIMLLQIVGCSKKVDVNELSVATGVAIDKGGNGDVELTVQIVNPITLARQPKDISPYLILTSNGETVFEAFRKLSGTLINRVFLSHFQVLIISEAAAKDGIEQYLNCFYVDHESQHKYNILIAKEKSAKDLLTVYTMLSAISAIAIEGKLESDAKYFGTTKITNIDTAMNSLRTEKVGLVLAGIELVGDPEKGAKFDSIKGATPSAYTRTASLAVFKDDKFVGWLNEDESKGFNFIRNGIENTIVVITLDKGNKISMEVNSVKSKFTINLINGRPNFIITTEASAIIGEDSRDEISNNEAYVKEATKKTEEEIKKIMDEAINKAQKEYKSDIFNLCEIIHRNLPKLWAQIKDDYDNVYTNMTVETKVKVTIVRIRY